MFHLVFKELPLRSRPFKTYPTMQLIAPFTVRHKDKKSRVPVTSHGPLKKVGITDKSDTNEPQLKLHPILVKLTSACHVSKKTFIYSISII